MQTITNFRLPFLLLAALLLDACAFHLRDQMTMPFNALYLDTGKPSTPMVAELKRSLEANHVKLVNTAAESDVILKIVFESTDKQILTLGGNGRVSEFRLNYHISFRAYDLKQRDWIPAEEMSLYRDLSYDDTLVLAKEAEENLLYKSMRSDIVQQIIRQLSQSKPQSLEQPN